MERRKSKKGREFEPEFRGKEVRKRWIQKGGGRLESQRFGGGGGKEEY